MTVTTPEAEKPFVPFVIVPVPVLEAGLSPQAGWLYVAIRNHADNTTGETWVGREKLAEYLGMTKVASVDRYIKELVDASLITSAPRWCSKLDKRNWVLEKDAEHTVQGSNLYTVTDIAAGQTGSFFGGPLGPVEGTPRVPQKGHELDPFNQTHGSTKDEKTSVAASAAPAKSVHKWINGEETAEPMPLHPEWTPNNANRAVAAKLGLDADTVAAAFRRAMLDADQRRRRWGAAFSEYLRAEADGTAAATFEVDDDALAAQAVEAAAEAWRDDPWGGLPVAAPAVEVVEDSPAVPASIVPAFVPAEGDDVEDQDHDGRRWVAQTEVDEHAPAPDAEAEREQVAQMFAEDAAVTEAQWQADLEERRIAANLQKINRRLTVVKLRAAEKVEAAEMLRNGMRNDDVYAAIVEARKARRAELTAAA